MEPWGKRDSAGNTHPLAHHMMDVAAVFERLLRHRIIAQRIRHIIGYDLTATDVARLAVFAFLHDVGKLHPKFQLQRGGFKHAEEGACLLITVFKDDKAPFHNMVAEHILRWTDITGGRNCSSYLGAIAAHHGYPGSVKKKDTLSWDGTRSDSYQWRECARVIEDLIAFWFPEAFSPQDRTLPTQPEFHHLVTGLIALADWIGSDNRYEFQFSDSFDRSYDAVARDRARNALRRVGLEDDDVPIPRTDFRAFSDFDPRPTQQLIGNLGANGQLVLLESETGSGKTEAALWRFALLYAAGQVSSLYFAVPTRAAASQLHTRVQDAVTRLFGPGGMPVVLAIPGMLKVGEVTGTALDHFDVLWSDPDASYEPDAAHYWAAEHATRFLAAPIAVGTVDQAMLAAMRAKHAYLRGAALSRSLLVIDEVHASDAYMTRIMAQLLDDHLSIGGQAMLMSATLGSSARRRFLKTEPVDFANAAETPYPAVWVKDEAYPLVPTNETTGIGKEVKLETQASMSAVEASAPAIEAARRGANVLVIRNTVRTAQATFDAVVAAGGIGLLLNVNGRPTLHHSRFAAEDRLLLNTVVETVLSKDRADNTPGCIVIGTQTLEQSLDIDADILITDLCPVDVLLQRIGRLHRHSPARPEDYREPKVLVLTPEGGLEPIAKSSKDKRKRAPSDPETSGLGNVYHDLVILELTRRLVEQEPVWRIPSMNRWLVESAMHEDRISGFLETPDSIWSDHYQTVLGREYAEKGIADLLLLRRTEPFETSLWESTERASTRLGDDSVVFNLGDGRGEIIGPFGQAISTLAIPAWMLRTSETDGGDLRSVIPKIEAIDGNTLRLTIGSTSFGYDPRGLHLEVATAHL